MKLNGARILDYPHLWRWLCRVYAMTGIAEAGSLIQCRQGYFGRSWNGVVPSGPIKPMAYPDAYNLNISRYISTAVEEEEIDLAITHNRLVDIEIEIQTSTEKHNAFLRELGLPGLPGTK